jgi:hypothetical protein
MYKVIKFTEKHRIQYISCKHYPMRRLGSQSNWEYKVTDDIRKPKHAILI